MKVKICGITPRSNIAAIKQAEPDFCGLIFHAQSPRNVDSQTAAKIIEELKDRTVCVGVFVDSTTDFVVETVTHLGLQYIQLHGSESAEYIQRLRQYASILKIIKCIKVSDVLLQAEIAQYEAVADYLLFDSAGRYSGGNGTQFNWKLLDSINLTREFFISGGIGIATIPELRALHGRHPMLLGVDANSKLELSPGQKDPTVTTNFIKQVQKI